MKKLTTTLAGTAFAAAAIFGAAAPANAAETSTADYNQQVQEDWGLMINEYFPGGYIPFLGY